MGTKDNEQRRLKRYPLFKSLRVYEEGTGLILGYLVDVNSKGMKLESNTPIPIFKNYSVYVQIVTEKVPLQVKSVWGKEGEDYFETGFQFLEVTPKTELNIKCLIEALKLLNPE